MSDKILIVDDDADFRRSLALALRGDGYDVLLATSHEEAIESLTTHSVDCVLMEAPTHENAADVRRHLPFAVDDTRVVMVSKKGDRDSVIAGLAGADDFVCKSDDYEVLAARVEAQLRRKRANDELLTDVREELARKDRELEAFSYSVSHDLRAPLRAISGFSTALLEECGDAWSDDARADLRRVCAAARRMNELIDALLDLSRLTRAPLSREEVDLSRLSRAILADLRDKEPNRVVEITVHEGLVAHADARFARVILENLVGNAWKFTSKVAVARIEVGTCERRGELAYVVRDNGAGFNEEYASKLFSPFRRLHGDAEFPGIGIGLAVVSRLVARHGGKVWAESTVGDGASFFFTLPAAAGLRRSSESSSPHLSMEETDEPR